MPIDALMCYTLLAHCAVLKCLCEEQWSLCSVILLWNSPLPNLCGWLFLSYPTL